VEFKPYLKDQLPVEGSQLATPSVLWHCWFGHMTCKNRRWYDL